MKLGVAITCHNRREVTENTVRQWRKHLPKGAKLIVVDDGSKEPYPRADFRFDKSVGIARAKNKCLEILMEDPQITDIFLADNDAWPISSNWYKPYVESPEPHLSYQFPDFSGPNKLNDMTEVYRDAKHVAYSGQRGCVLYYHRSAIEAVGGFDPIYGRAMYEHTDLACRIHYAGLTSWRYADVVGSEALWYSMDEHQEIERTIPNDELRALNARNARIFNERGKIGYTAYVDYKENISDARENVLITTLLTANVDPQRGIKWDPSPKAISPWLESVERGGWHGVVLADELTSASPYSAEVVRVLPSEMNVYYQRWLHIYQYLRSHEEVQWVWCTDGSDVEILRDPFENMQHGKLYVGSETGKVGSQWMIKNHPSEPLQKFITENSQKKLLNAGVVGGDRETVMKLAHMISSEWTMDLAERFWRKRSGRTCGPNIGDMAAFNKVAYEHFGGRLITGSKVTTEFGKYEDNGEARFRHK